MAGVAVVTDSTSSLPPRLAAHAGVHVVPLSVVIGGTSRPEDAVGPAEVADALRGRRPVSTSRPTSEAFRAVYEQLAAAGHQAVVSAHLSGAMSGTAAAATAAAARAPLPVRVVDTRTAAMAAGFAVLAGAEAARRGADVDRVAEVVLARAAAGFLWFCVDDLEHLRRGGRIGTASAALGSALAMKPLLTVSGGRIRSLERVRTTARAVARLEELAVAAAATAVGRGVGVEVAVHHLDDEPAAVALAERLRSRTGGADGTVVGEPVISEPVVSELSAVLAVHVGPGTLGVVVSPTG